MERVEIREITPPAGQGLEYSAEPRMRALSERYAARGLVKSVMDGAAEQIRHEEETRALAPEAYRLSLLTDTAICVRYRRGKDTMSSADLIRYFDETRSLRLHNVDFSGNLGKDECEGSNIKEECVALTAKKQVQLPVSAKKVKELPRIAGEKLKAALPTWFNSAKPDTSSNQRRFPVSAFAAMAAVAASLMLIVASSVLIRRAESDLSRTQSELSDLSAQYMELKSDMEVQNDLLQIREIAMEEYGMIGEDFVKMDYISLRAEDSVEVYEEEREESVGLSALLSAIGIKK